MKNKTPFECIILAGGLGTRLASLLPDTPKPLAPIAGKPFLDYLLAYLKIQGCARLILSVGYKADQIIKRYGAFFENIPVSYSREAKPLGTGGALKLALDHCDAPQAIAINGDTFAEVNFQEFISHLHSQRPLLSAMEVADCSRYGALRLNAGKVLKFMEKGQTGQGFINAGAYRLPKNILAAFPEDKFSFEKDYLEAQIKISPLNCFISKGFFLDIGTPQDYLLAQTILPSFLQA